MLDLQFPRSDSWESGFKKMSRFQWAVQWFRVESYMRYINRVGFQGLECREKGDENCYKHILWGISD